MARFKIHQITEREDGVGYNKRISPPDTYFDSSIPLFRIEFSEYTSTAADSFCLLMTRRKGQKVAMLECDQFAQLNRIPYGFRAVLGLVLNERQLSYSYLF